MRKFIHREENESNDPLVAEQRTILFKKTQQEGINDPEFNIESDNDQSQLSKLIYSQRAKTQSGNAYAMEKLKQSIENSRKARERLAMRVSEKTKTVTTEKNNLEANQQKLKSILEQSKLKSPATDPSQNNVNSTLNVLQQQFELMNLDQKTAEDKITLESLEEMEGMIRKITHQINNALDFMQNSPLVIESHDILSLIKDTASGINIPYGINLELPTNTDTVHCDSEKLKSVFRNIIINAIDAMDESGKIIIKISNEVHHCIISIENSGPSIPEENMQNIFEPLFTTKENGSGLGLARCKDIVQRHGGKISVHNNPTRFIVQLVRKQ